MFYERLKEERERLGFTQPQFAGIGCVSLRSQQSYETEKGSPNFSYLQEIAKVGADVQYIITGVHSVKALTDDETLILESYRKATPQVRLFMLQGIQPQQTSSFVHNSGTVRQQINTEKEVKIIKNIKRAK